MRAARNAHERRRVRIHHAADRIHPSARSVEDHLRADAVFAARFLVARGERLNPAAAALDPRHREVVERKRAVLNGRAHERHVEARVVELAIVELHAAHQAFGLHARKARNRFFTREAARAADAVAAEGHRGVDPQADRVVLALPLLVAGKDEGLRVHEMRSVLNENAALLERFAHQSPVAGILHVAHAAVNELRRTG